MLERFKKKTLNVLVPISVGIINTSVVYGTDDITRKMNRGKVFVLGLLTIAAAINVAYAIFKAGAAKGQSEIESAEKYRRNAWIALLSMAVLDVAIGLWNSW